MEVIQHSLKLYRQAFIHCLPLSILIAVGINFPFLFFEYREPLDFLDEIFTWQDYKSGLMLAIWVLTFIGLETLIIRIHSIKIQSPNKLRQDVADALGDFLPLLLVGLLYSIIVICGIAFLIIPGVIFAVSLMFAFVIRILEHRDVFESIVASHRLVWGHWWYTVLVVSIPALANLIAFLGILMFVVGLMTNFTANWEHAQLFAFILNTVLQIAFIPFIFSTVLSLYYDLKSKQNN